MAHGHVNGATASDSLGYYGDNSSNQNPNYYGAWYTVGVNSGIRGKAWVTQLISGSATNSATSPPNGYVIAGTELDGSYKYPRSEKEIAINDPLNTNGLVELGDNPSVPCYLSTDINLRFTDYICFCPDGTGSIAVTLGTVAWRVNAATDLSSGDYSPPVPSSISSVELPYLAPTGGAGLDGSPTDSSDFPLWQDALIVTP